MRWHTRKNYEQNGKTGEKGRNTWKSTGNLLLKKS